MPVMNGYEATKTIRILTSFSLFPSFPVSSAPTMECRQLRSSDKNSGIGMSEEFVSHIFEPFEREKSSTISGIQGTGLRMT